MSNCIAVFQSDLHVGGITKSLINFVHILVQCGFEVDVFVFDEGDFFNEKFSSNVHVFYLKRSCRLIKYLPYTISYKLYSPDINLKKKYFCSIDYNSFWHECSIAAQKVNSDFKIMWLHSDIIKKQQFEFRYRVAWNLYKARLKNFDIFVAVSKSVRDSFYRSVAKNLQDKKTAVINNIVNVEEIRHKSAERINFSVDENITNFVSVGHLGYEKGFDILINYFKDAVRQNPDIHLYIIGDGPEKKNLEAQAAKNNLERFITFLGNKVNPYAYMQKMDCFILTSRYEGQGIAILEAKAIGLDIIIAKNLEQYNEGIYGTENITQAIISYKKKKKKPDDLSEYNSRNYQEILKLLKINCE